MNEYRRQDSLAGIRNAIALATLVDALNNRAADREEPDWVEALQLAREMTGSMPSPEGWTNDRAAYVAMGSAHLVAQLATYGAGVTNEMAERDGRDERLTPAELLQGLAMAIAVEDTESS